jgi:hypothetical protein
MSELVEDPLQKNDPATIEAAYGGQLIEPIERQLEKNHQAAIQAILTGKGKYDTLLLKWSDWLNPILVKETRQALKSRQFTWTFALLLIAVVGWTVAGISLMVPGIYYMASGGSLLSGYFLILLVPVGVVVPFSAFRSMAAELEDGTFEILSISSLTPRQIVVGKLTVAALQATIYFSALAPCIALTYLLRGIPIQIVVLVLGGTAILSVVLSTLAILLASLGRNRSGQVGMLLMLMLVVFPANFSWASLILSFISESQFPETWEAWLSMAVFTAFCLSYVWLGIQAAAARIGFAADNHSTAIRWILLLQHFAYIVVFTSAQFLYEAEDEAWVAMMSILGFHWGIAGAMMVGEQGVLSPRARRTLPKTLEGRVFLTWLNPGSGTGYVFSVLCYLSAAIYVLIVTSIKWKLNEPLRYPLYEFSFLCVAYLAFYLGLTRLIMLVLGKFLTSRLVGSVAITIVLILFGAMGPMFYSYWQNNFRMAVYEFYLFPNIFWTISYIDDSLKTGALYWLSIVAAIVFQANLLFLTRDVMLVRVEAPPRVRQERNEPTPETDAPVDPLAV